VLTKAYAQLGLQGGPAAHPAAALALADLSSRVWLVISAAQLGQDGARRLAPARSRRCRRWAWRHFCELAREHHSLSAPQAAALNELYGKLRDAARTYSFSMRSPELSWI